MYNLFVRITSKLALLIEAFLRNRLPRIYFKRKNSKTVKDYRDVISSLFSKKPGDYPKSIAIEINNTCNLNCLMCSTQQAKRPKGEMSTGLFEKIVKEISGYGQKHLRVHTVGEPFYYSNLHEIFRIIKKYGMDLRLTTNGLLLHKHMGLIKQYPGLISCISFSIDGATKETFEKIRKGGKFDQLIQNLDLIYDYNKNAKKHDRVPIYLQTVISEDNFDEIALFPKVFKKYFSPEKIRHNFIFNILATHGDSNYYKSKKITADKLQRLNAPCSFFWNSCFILWNGYVTVCCYDYNGELIMGNILKQSIADIWKGSLYENCRNAHRSLKTQEIPLCKDCWRIAPEASTFLTCYIDYLLRKFKNQPDKFYAKKVRDKIKALNDNYTDNFIFNDFS